MKYISLKNNKKQFSQIALGTTNFGTVVDEKSALKMLDTFADLGGTTIDTALRYGQERDENPGKSEKIIGKWLKSNNMYKEMTIVTKGLFPSLETNKGRMTLEHLKKDLDISFRSLTIHELDLWFFHRDDRSQEVSVMVDLIDQITPFFPVNSFGASNWESSRLQEAKEYAISHNLTQFSASEIQWSLAHTSSLLHEDDSLVCMDEKEKAWYETNQLPLFTFSSQAKGFFSKYINDEEMNEKLTKRFGSKDNIERAQRVNHLCESYHLSPATIAISYITSAPFPTIAIIGSSRVEQLTDSLANSDFTLSEKERIFLDTGKEE
jgi:aryl-alcohol dehydrogenase-like predicted oxidoreductase